MLHGLYTRYGKRAVRITLAVIVVLGSIGVYLSKEKAVDPAQTETTSLPLVSVRTVRDLVGSTNFSVVGTVRSVSEAELQAEAGGRVTSVNVSIGDTVRAGQILSTIENASEHAQLLQAQGAYDSALSGSESSSMSLSEAKVRVQNVYRDTYATADNILSSDVNIFFSNVGDPISGFRLSGTGRSLEIIAMRNAVETKLKKWSETLKLGTEQTNETEMLASGESALTALNALIVEIYQIVSNPDNKSELTPAEIATYQGSLSGARSELGSALGSISGARENFDQAVLSSESGSLSQASAQLKSALGILRNAQSNYEKTIIRTPISGVVNALYVKQGAYVSMGNPAARVANNGALEITAGLGEKDLLATNVGDTVLINDTIPGSITKIAPAIDPTTGKAEVKISVEKNAELANGTTVSISFNRKTEVKAQTKISVPLATLKLLPSGPIAFTVSEENLLVAIPVTLGVITGDSVEIVQGLSETDRIVTDARGLKAGDKVTIAN